MRGRRKRRRGKRKREEREEEREEEEKGGRGGEGHDLLMDIIEKRICKYLTKNQCLKHYLVTLDLASI